MKAIVIREPGGPEVLSLEEVPEPSLGAGQIAIDVKATALNRADLLQRRGIYPPPTGESEILGLECAGVVAAHGPGASGPPIGSRVMALLAGGGYAERVVIPGRMALPIPDGLSFEQAAAIPAVAAAVAADGEWTGAQAECAARPDSDRELFVTARTRAGRLDGLHIESHVTGGLDDSPIAARALASDHFPGTIRPYLDRPGWSAGSRLGIPWTRELASQFATEADVSEGRFMAWSAAVGYRHPCGCFAVVGRTGQRVGRDGLDAEVTLDLMP